MKPFELEIITPEVSVFKGRIYSLVIPAYEGYMGILAGHSSFIGVLQKGNLSFENPSDNTKEKNTYLVSDGFVEIKTIPFSTTKVTVLTEKVFKKV
jgi:F-type H+-transporting ATPase subunit epsilon